MPRLCDFSLADGKLDFFPFLLSLGVRGPDDPQLAVAAVAAEVLRAPPAARPRRRRRRETQGLAGRDVPYRHRRIEAIN